LRHAAADTVLKKVEKHKHVQHVQMKTRGVHCRSCYMKVHLHMTTRGVQLSCEHSEYSNHCPRSRSRTQSLRKRITLSRAEVQ
jgi:hypothetical protein